MNACFLLFLLKLLLHILIPSLYAFSLSVRSHFYFTISMLFVAITQSPFYRRRYLFSFSPTHTLSLHSTYIHSAIHLSIFMLVFFSLVERLFFNHFFLHLFGVSAQHTSCYGCEDSVVWCKHNLSHYPKTVSAFFRSCSLSMILLLLLLLLLPCVCARKLTCSFAFSVVGVRCGCDLPFTSTCITRQL